VKLGIMQPYFFPYIGYFQLMNSVDKFVIYDDIEFTKRGWIRRNRFLLNGKDSLFSLPLKNDSDYLDIVERELSENYEEEAEKILRRLSAAYQKAPYFEEVYPLIERCFLYEDRNLFNFIYNSIKEVVSYLNLETTMLVSSELGIEERLKGEERVLSICKHLGTDHYINAIGGKELYDKKRFLKEGVRLSFIKSGEICYEQFGKPFVESLSIVDVMMFNSPEEINAMLDNYELI
jgi:hypothetical protein